MARSNNWAINIDYLIYLNIYSISLVDMFPSYASVAITSSWISGFLDTLLVLLVISEVLAEYGGTLIQVADMSCQSHVDYSS